MWGFLGVKHPAIIVCALLCACGAPESLPAPPVASSSAPTAAPTPTRTNPPPGACEAYEDCAVACGAREFGDAAETQADREWCLDNLCEAPGKMQPANERTWGLACMAGDDELCEQGAELCT